ncbi:MAG: carbamoyltransferase family protein [Gammaproteobacteria bacterium]
MVVDGKLVAAAEEERFRRIKHWAGFPSEAIRYCLKEAGIGLSAVEHIALNQDRKANLLRKIAYTVTQRPDPAMLLDRLRNKRKRLSVAEQLQAVFPGETFCGHVHAVEHHLAHLSSAFHVAPFDKAVALSVDGFGDFASTAWGLGDGGALAVDGKIYFPHSLGIFYQALTQFLGFPHYGDEYKIMGLAPYGEPSYLAQMRDIVRLQEDGGFVLNLAYFRHHREKIAYQWENGSPEVGTLFTAELERLLGPKRTPQAPLTQRHRDIARSVQAMYEEAFFHLLNRLYEHYRLDTLTLAGGCAMNSVANGKICLQTPFRRVYVQSAAGDAGGAIGAAYAVWHKLGGERKFVMDHAYWGPAADAAEIAALLTARRTEMAEQGCAVEHCADEDGLLQRTAEAIAVGKVVGWFQGRMEWGPRALGSRSILGDPRRADMKDILNSKIKRRESFRPFAPSILREAVGDWFEQDGDVPFMMQVFQIRPERRAAIPAVTHVDGSGRLQTVSLAANPRYYRLIEAFHKLTGVPMLLNTSFNENEPVVCRPQEALECFLRTHMDVLVLGDYFICRAGKVD